MAGSQPRCHVDDGDVEGAGRPERVGGALQIVAGHTGEVEL
jgi:hypothetical protein